jgi:hypothetical protein
MTSDFTAIISYGSLTTSTPSTFAWPGTEVMVDAPFTGLHVAHVAIGACVLNDLRREARRLELPISGVRVSVRGGFDLPGAVFGAIEYILEVDSPAPPDEVTALADFVETLAEIPRAIADSVEVTRVAE